MTKQQSALTTLLLTWLAALCTACTADSLTTAEDLPPTTQTGVLCLRLSSDPVFVHVETRGGTALNLEDYTFTLNNGTTSTPVTFDENNAAIIPAGTYTLTATNEDSADPYAGPVYSGTSESFTLTAGGTAEIPLTLTPQNSKVSYTVSENFASTYTIESFTVGGTYTLASTSAEQFIPAGDVSYTITAKANQNSHVQEFTTITGTLAAQAGKQHTIHLDAKPIDDNLYDIFISCKDQTHEGEFE